MPRPIELTGRTLTANLTDHAPEEEGGASPTKKRLGEVVERLRNEGYRTTVNDVAGVLLEEACSKPTPSILKTMRAELRARLDAAAS